MLGSKFEKEIFEHFALRLRGKKVQKIWIVFWGCGGRRGGSRGISDARGCVGFEKVSWDALGLVRWRELREGKDAERRPYGLLH